MTMTKNSAIQANSRRKINTVAEIMMGSNVVALLAG
jgi:hypothetical protein